MIVKSVEAMLTDKVKTHVTRGKVVFIRSVLFTREK